jgi:hypothetical protein
MALTRTAKSCGSGAPMPASSLREAAQATVSNKHGHRGEREVSRKTIARGMPGRFGVTVVTTLVCLFFYTRGCGRIERPAFPAPSDLQKAERSWQTSRGSRGEIAKLCVMRTSAPSPHMSSPGLTGRPSIPETHENNREAAAYWIVRSRLRQGFDGACDLPARRSFSEGGKPDDDSCVESGKAITRRPCFRSDDRYFTSHRSFISASRAAESSRKSRALPPASGWARLAARL